MMTGISTIIDNINTQTAPPMRATQVYSPARVMARKIPAAIRDMTVKINALVEPTPLIFIVTTSEDIKGCWLALARQPVWAASLPQGDLDAL